MQAKFGAIVISGSGKIGGQAFSRTGGRAKLSAIAPGRKRNSVRNFNASIRFGVLSQIWKAQTQSARDSWQIVALPGESLFNTFVRCNMGRATSGFGAIGSYATSDSSISLVLTTAAADESAQTITFASMQTNTNFARVHVSISPQQSPGVKVNKRGYWMADYGTSSGTANRAFGTGYNARYGRLIAGKKIFYKVESFDQSSGVKIQSFESFLIVSP